MRPFACCLVLLALALPRPAAAAARSSALELVRAARPEIAARLDRATRAVLAAISPAQADALARGERALADLRLPDGTPLASFLRGVLGDGPWAVPFASLDAGGGESAGGGFHVLGTIGQPDAAVLEGEGGWLLVGGWRGRVVTDFVLFRDGFEGGDTGRWSATGG